MLEWYFLSKSETIGEDRLQEDAVRTAGKQTLALYPGSRIFCSLIDGGEKHNIIDRGDQFLTLHLVVQW
jgi:hypothetical protein